MFQDGAGTSVRMEEHTKVRSRDTHTLRRSANVSYTVLYMNAGCTVMDVLGSFNVPY